MARPRLARMARTRPERMRRALLLLLALSLPPSLAQGGDASQYTVGQYAYEKLSEANEAIAEEKFAEARAVLEQMAEKRGLNPHEQALLYQTLGMLEAEQENYAGAARHVEKSLALQALPPDQQLRMTYNLAQLYVATEQFDRAIPLLEKWFAQTENPQPLSYYQLAGAYVQAEQSEKALAPARKAVELSESPKESWIQLLVALYFEKREYAKIRPLLEQLVERFPKKTYWMQLAAVYSELGEEKKSLAVHQIAYEQGLLDRDAEIRMLAQLLLFHELPYRAGRVLEKGLEDGVVEADASAYELLANSWISARNYERAIAPLERAAELSKSGDLYVRLAQVQMERERWDEAVAALRAAIEKGGLDDPGRPHLLLGICSFRGGNLDGAERSFQRARQFEVFRHDADLWLRQVERERANREIG